MTPLKRPSTALVACAIACAAQCFGPATPAANASPNPSDPTTTPYEHWLLHIDATAIVPNPSAAIFVAGNRVPAASISLNSSATITGDLSYFLTPHLAANLYVGIPPRAIVSGAGSIAALGPLGTSLYGPAILSGEYHFSQAGAFKPYVGIGANYTIFLNNHDAALTNVHVPNAWGVGFGLGADYDLTKRVTFNAYARQVLLSTTVHATFAGAPARAGSTINPTLFGFGFGYRF